MPHFSRIANIINDSRVRKPVNAAFTISPAFPSTGCTVVNFIDSSNRGIIRFTSNGAFNVTPNTTFSANVLMWGGGGGASVANGGGGGFSYGVITFYANVSYNVVIGAGGTTAGSGGGGTGIEYLANANTILSAGGGGGGAPGGAGGAGGGIIAANGAGGSAAGSRYSAGAPGSLKVGGDGGSGLVGYGRGGSGAGGGGGGLYGGGSSASGGAGGGGFFDTRIIANSTQANTITGNGRFAAGNTDVLYSAGVGEGASAPSGVGSDGRIILVFVS